jgi:hypothetical protein
MATIKPVKTGSAGRPKAAGGIKKNEAAGVGKTSPAKKKASAKQEKIKEFKDRHFTGKTGKTKGSGETKGKGTGSASQESKTDGKRREIVKRLHDKCGGDASKLSEAEQRYLETSLKKLNEKERQKQGKAPADKQAAPVQKNKQAQPGKPHQETAKPKPGQPVQSKEGSPSPTREQLASRSIDKYLARGDRQGAQDMIKKYEAAGIKASKEQILKAYGDELKSGALYLKKDGSGWTVSNVKEEAGADYRRGLVDYYASGKYGEDVKDTGKKLGDALDTGVNLDSLKVKKPEFIARQENKGKDARPLTDEEVNRQMRDGAVGALAGTWNFGVSMVEGIMNPGKVVRETTKMTGEGAKDVTAVTKPFQEAAQEFGKGNVYNAYETFVETANLVGSFKAKGTGVQAVDKALSTSLSFKQGAPKQVTAASGKAPKSEAPAGTTQADPVAVKSEPSPVKPDGRVEVDLMDVDPRLHYEMSTKATSGLTESGAVKSRNFDQARFDSFKQKFSETNPFMEDVVKPGLEQKAPEVSLMEDAARPGAEHKAPETSSATENVAKPESGQTPAQGLMKNSRGNMEPQHADIIESQLKDLPDSAAASLEGKVEYHVIKKGETFLDRAPELANSSEYQFDPDRVLAARGVNVHDPPSGVNKVVLKEEFLKDGNAPHETGHAHKKVLNSEKINRQVEDLYNNPEKDFITDVARLSPEEYYAEIFRSYLNNRPMTEFERTTLDNRLISHADPPRELLQIMDPSGYDFIHKLLTGEIKF